MNPRGISPEVFNAARAGDRQAIERLLVASQPHVRRYARLACSSASDAEDATQETLWLMFRHLGTIRTLLALPAWLRTVIKRECLRLARKAGLLLPIDEASAQLDLTLRSDADLRVDLAAAVASLPDHYREIVLMRDVAEMTIEEISTSLDLTEQSAKARLHRARVMTREFLSA